MRRFRGVKVTLRSFSQFLDVTLYVWSAIETLGRVRVNRFERNRNQIYGIHFCAKISRCQGDSQILLLANFGCYCCWHWCCSWRSLSCHTIKVLVYTPGPLPFSSSGNEILWLNAGNVISEVIHHVINRVFSASICLSGIMKVTFLVAGGSAEPRFLRFHFNACMGHSYHFSNELLSTFYRVKSLPKSLIRSRNWFLR